MFAESSSLAWFYEETFRWGQMAEEVEATADIHCAALELTLWGLMPEGAESYAKA